MLDTLEERAAVRFRVGNQTAFSATDEMAPFQFALDHRFSAFEWFADRKGEQGICWSNLSASVREQIRDQAAARGILLTVHAPWQASVCSGGGPASLLESIDFARDVSAPIVVVHLEKPESLEQYAKALSRILSYALERGVRVALENTVETGPEDVNRVFRGLRDWGVPEAAYGLCLDIGHANVCQATRHDYVRFIDSLAPTVPILHAHLHENWGDADNHLLLFTGPSSRDPSGIRAVLERLVLRGFEGALILEVWPDPPERLLEARDRLEALAGEVIGGLRGQDAPVASATRPDPETLAELSDPSPRIDPAALEPFVRRIAKANEEHRSWLRRLEWVRDTLKDAGVRQSEDALAALGVYLHFVGSGAIQCQEDGGHHRPSHHAALALDIERQLLESEPRPALALARRILRWLPSHDAPFRRAEPLTRIRDLAHRNDIPKELKLEIKTTLQNKLHRSAGPEDLATSARLLQRLQGHSELPSDFLEELGTFHRELEEFFNANSLERELHLISPSVSDDERVLMLQLMACLERGSQDAGHQDEELSLNEKLRKRLAGSFWEAGDSLMQRKRTLDMKLEDRAFVVLGERIHRLEGTLETSSWVSSIKPLELALHHVALSGILEEHCLSLSEALEQWGTDSGPEDREHLLRLAALLALGRWVVTRAMDQMLLVLAGPAEQLGAVLGLPAERTSVFSEGEVRRSLVYQVSRVAELLTDRIRRDLGASAWQSVVPGTAVGQFVGVETLEALPPGPGPWIAVVGRAQGDETLPGSLSGALVLRELPLLSHFAIRARQAGVVMAAGGGEGDVPTALLGCRGWLQVGATGVALGEGDAPRAAMHHPEPMHVAGRAGVQAAVVAEDLRRLELIELEAATVERAGPKAYASRRLLELSRMPDAELSAPDGFVIPFGAMESTLGSVAQAADEYAGLVDRLSHAEGDVLAALCQRLHDLVLSLELPRSLFERLGGVLEKGRRYAVRSSGNFEDLAGYSAAGLHDSVIGVSPDHVGRAVLRVWASLHSVRAVVARREAGAAPRDARMAVLIQPLVSAEASFVMFTRSPFGRGHERAYVELAAGLGEVLTSASHEGSPLRVEVDKQTGEGEVLAFPTLPTALAAASGRQPEWRVVHYARVPWVTSRELRHRIIRQLAHAATALEHEFGGPQDAEGALVNGTLTMVQSRPTAAEG